MENFVCRICGHNTYVSLTLTEYSCKNCGVIFFNPCKFSLPKVQLKYLSEDAKMPIKGSEEAAGYDLFSTKDVILEPNKPTIIPIDISVALPKGTEMQIRTRSGFAKKGLIVANAPGTVDSDYRGPIMVMLFNTTNEPIKINKGIRVAQACIKASLPYEFELVDELDDTERGSGGFGSTGEE